MQKQNYEFIGAAVTKMFPQIAEALLKRSQFENELSDYADMKIISKAFSDYYKINFPGDLIKLPLKNSTDYKIKFTAVCLYFYDRECISGIYKKKIKYGLRKSIADHIGINKSHISIYLPKARIYMTVYKDFELEIEQLIGILQCYVDKEIKTLTK